MSNIRRAEKSNQPVSRFHRPSEFELEMGVEHVGKRACESEQWRYLCRHLIDACLLIRHLRGFLCLSIVCASRPKDDSAVHIRAF